jgi:hypothetical protein
MDLKERSASSSAVALLLLLPGGGSTRASEQRHSNESQSSVIAPSIGRSSCRTCTECDGECNLLTCVTFYQGESHDDNFIDMREESQTAGPGSPSFLTIGSRGMFGSPLEQLVTFCTAIISTRLFTQSGQYNCFGRSPRTSLVDFFRLVFLSSIQFPSYSFVVSILFLSSIQFCINFHGRVGYSG